MAELEDPVYEILAGTTPPKKALFGRVLSPGHPVSEALLGNRIVYPEGSSNPIWYEAIPELDTLVEEDQRQR